MLIKCSYLSKANKEVLYSLVEVEDGCQSVVGGKRLYITTDIMAKISQASTEGYVEFNFSDKETILRLICEKDEVNLEAKISASQLPTKMRFLHSIICHILFSRIDRFYYLIERDLILMYCILKKILINLPQLMIVHMCEAAVKTHASLPYGMILTLIF